MRFDVEDSERGPRATNVFVITGTETVDPDDESGADLVDEVEGDDSDD